MTILPRVCLEASLMYKRVRAVLPYLCLLRCAPLVTAFIPRSELPTAALLSAQLACVKRNAYNSNFKSDVVHCRGDNDVAVVLA